MPTLFTLSARRGDAERQARAERDGGLITVVLDGPRQAGTAREASRLAREYMAEFLVPAQRPGTRWGLMVTVEEGSAVYGDWPRGPGGGDPSFSRTRLARIRARWPETSGPISALQNAMEIVHAYVD